MPLRISLIAAVVGIAIYLLHQSGFRRLQLLRGRTTAGVVLLLCWATLSVPGALNRGTAFGFLTKGYVEIVLIYFLILGAVRSLRDVERLALVYCSSTALYAAVVLARFHLNSGEWRLGSLYYYDANDFATLAVTAIPLNLYFILRGPRVPRVVSAFALPAIFVVFVRAGSRGGFLAILAISLFVLFGYTTVRPKWRVLGMCALAALFVATAGEQYWTQIHTIVEPDQDYNRTADNGRVKIWKRGIGYMLQHPLLGVGIQNFPIAEGTISPLAWRQQYHIGVPWTAAHNSFVEIGAELGIPGLLFFVAAILSALATLRRVASARPPPGSGAQGPAALAQALTASLIGFTVGGFFLALAYHEMLYTLLALAAGLGKVTLPRTSLATTRGGRVGRVVPTRLATGLATANPLPRM